MNISRRVFLSFALWILLALFASGCATGWRGEDRDFRQDMRDFVGSISEYGKGRTDGFLIVPQNGQELVTADGEPDGPSAPEYLDIIDAFEYFE